MIRDRPAALIADPRYQTPPLPYLLDWSPVPELVRASIGDLIGPQPITGELASISSERVWGEVPEVEQQFYRDRGTGFQMISIVASTIAVETRDDVSVVTPFALSLIPASKRGQVDTSSIDFVAHVADNQGTRDTAYIGYNPFSGDWAMYGPTSVVTSIDNGHLDEVGLIVGRYHLATDHNPDDILSLGVGMPNQKLTAKYNRKRSDLMFQPFQRVEARRIWGAESPIELFLTQYLALHGCHPAIQMLIMDNGSTYPSWYHLWKDLEIRHAPGLVTEADLFFEDHRLAVFCDGAHHLRRKQRLKDEAIVASLRELGIRSVRIPGSLINFDIKAAGAMVLQALNDSS